MNEFIEREALWRAMQSIIEDPTCPLHIAATVDQYITEAPAADVVGVVRCKDCKHFGRNFENDTYCSCVGCLSDPEEDDFCSYGERRNPNDHP